LGIGDWGLGIGPNPQSPIPNPQSPIPNPQNIKISEKCIYFIITIIKFLIKKYNINGCITKLLHSERKVKI